MTRQKQAIEQFFASTSEATLETKEAKMPGGGTLPLGAGIINGPLKWLAAYKLQLFLYAKATGPPDRNRERVGRDRLEGLTSER